jgi:hypothetical protein
MSSTEPGGFSFNPPPGWPVPGDGWSPPQGWKPEPSWPTAPDGWVFWVPSTAPVTSPPPVTAPAVTPLVAPTPVPAPSPTPAPVASAMPAPTPTMPAPAPTPPQSAAAAPVTGAGGDRVAQLEATIAELRAQLAASGSGEVVELDDERALQEVGIYRYHHPVENSEEYKVRLAALQEEVKEFVKAGTSILASDMFTFNGSLGKGRKMTADFSKLMLRAYNAEADNCVRTVRAGNLLTATKRLEAAVVSIQKLGSMMEMQINPAYHALRIREIELTADFQMKVQAEREEAREERERLREERRAEAELAAERERLDKERSHYANALAAVATSGDEAEIAVLQAKLAELEEAIEANDYRAANIRAGYVYVISNPGAFGTHVVKIGMTRRLEPLDRVRELGDASVPFPFCVHALFFSDDAITLETELHNAFAERKVNRVNERREFFFATPLEVRELLAAKVGNLLEFTEHPEATEYFQSLKYWPEGIESGPA